MSNISHTTAGHAIGALIGDDQTSAATLYFALSTTTPTVTAGAITNVNEPSGGDYARVAVTNSSTNFEITDNTGSNLTAVTFPTASGTWGAITHLVAYDAASAGNALWFGGLTGAPVSVNTGSTVEFAAGTISIVAS